VEPVLRWPRPPTGINIISTSVNILMFHREIISAVIIKNLSDNKTGFLILNGTIKINSMKKPFPSTLISVLGITLILMAVLSRRMSIRNFNDDSLLSFLAGVAIFFICYLIFRTFLKKKK